MTDWDVVLKLYTNMLMIRYIEETIAIRYSEWKMRCPTHLSIGQEAIASGTCFALDKSDFVMSTHRSHAHYLAKGGDPNKMIAEIYGKETGCSAGRGGSMHLIDKTAGFMGSTSIVGNTIPLAVGLGLSIKLQNSKQLSCVFFGDGSVEEGVFYESINFAVLKKLPVLFICENNLYSVYSSLRVRQPQKRKIYRMAKGMGIKSEIGDGNNVLEVFDRTKKAVSSIRKGQGPILLEFSTYRWLEHCGPNYDNDLGYRSIDEFTTWKKRDPILSLEKQLLENSIIAEKQNIEMKNTCQKIADKAFDFAENSPFPKSEDAYTNLYAE